MSIHKSHVFKSDYELYEFSLYEVMKYTGTRCITRIAPSYNRLTPEEIAQEVVLKVLRSVTKTGKYNKTFVRQAVMFVCLDLYRKCTDMNPPSNEQRSEIPEDHDDPKTFELTDRLLTLKVFKGRDLEIVKLMMEGYRNPEIREALDIPKMSYYTALKRIKKQYSQNLRNSDIEEQEQSLMDIM